MTNSTSVTQKRNKIYKLLKIKRLSIFGEPFFMNIILFDDNGRANLLPLCYTRPCGDIRVGILTIAKKWEYHLTAKMSFLTQDYLSIKFPTLYSKENYYINGRLLVNHSILELIKELQTGDSLHQDGNILAHKSSKKYKNYSSLDEACTSRTEIKGDSHLISFTHDIFSLNGQQIHADFDILTAGRNSEEASKTNTLIGDNIFIESGASIEAAVLNSTKGPIYIGKNATVMEGSLIKGPFALCEESTIKMGSKIYGDTTVGPQCKVGGEVSNSVFFANSNKGHDGFIGNSVIGEWCNLGAGTNSSNLKNNYAEVKLWNYPKKRFTKTGLQFCGLIMGDHSKCGINTMFNTGTVVGVSANIFGAGFPRNFIPSFTWGGSSGFATYSLSKCCETARLVMERRNETFDEIEKDILEKISQTSEEFRFWENKPLHT